DGQWFAYVNEPWNEIKIRPVTGGNEQIIYSFTQFPEYENDPAFRKLQPNLIFSLCFSPDSKEIAFTQWIFDTELGSTYQIDFNEDGSIGNRGFNNPILYIESINIYTGEHKVLRTGNYPKWDPSGRFIAYTNFDYREYIDGLQSENHGALMILDLVTGESWVAQEKQVFDFTFTSDGQYILFNNYLPNDSTPNANQIFRCPISGGEPEQISFIQDETFGYTRNLVCSTDGKWLVFTKFTNIEIDINYGTDNDPHTTGSIRYYKPKNLVAMSLSTGKCYDIHPLSNNIESIPLAMSHDGSQLYFWVRDHYLDHYYIRSGEVAKHIWIVRYDFKSEAFKDTPTLVEEEVPRQFTSIKNYPNPFNPTTTITFTLQEAGNTELVVYNMTGQRIRNLVSRELNAGIHEVVWDGRDNNGIPVSSGVFVSQLISGENVSTNRMTLVR
ncbi:FlgD immunoglobulin-like domain containing protein, partial [Candidatus Latescibacterota bacterium]